MQKKIGFWSLGGTIAMGSCSEDNSSDIAPNTAFSSISDIKEAPQKGVWPSLDAKALLALLNDTLPNNYFVSAQSLACTASANISIPLLLSIAQKILTGPEAAVIITQGTDTLDQTAYLLDILVGSVKPVIVTGAMRPAQALSADGPANLSDSFTLASAIVENKTALTGGVYVVINSEIHDPAHVRKTHTALTSAFRSEGGALGHIAESRIFLSGFVRPRSSFYWDAPEELPIIRLVTIALDDKPDWLHQAVTGCKGLVVEAYGAGHVSEIWADALESIAQYMPVVFASTVGGGSVFKATYGYKGAEIDLLARGLVSAGRLSATKARLALMVAITKGRDAKSLSDPNAQDIPKNWAFYFNKLADF